MEGWSRRGRNERDTAAVQVRDVDTSKDGNRLKVSGTGESVQLGSWPTLRDAAAASLPIESDKQRGSFLNIMQWTSSHVKRIRNA